MNQRSCFAAADLQQQFRRPFDRSYLTLRVNASLKSGRRIRVQTVASRLTSHELLRPKCGLEENVCGRFTNCSRQTTHYACEADWTAVITDYQRVIAERNFSFIQKRELLAGSGKSSSSGSSKGSIP